MSVAVECFLAWLRLAQWWAHPKSACLSPNEKTTKSEVVSQPEEYDTQCAGCLGRVNTCSLRPKRSEGWGPATGDSTTTHDSPVGVAWDCSVVHIEELLFCSQNYKKTYFSGQKKPKNGIFGAKMEVLALGA